MGAAFVGMAVRRSPSFLSPVLGERASAVCRAWGGRRGGRRGGQRGGLQGLGSLGCLASPWRALLPGRMSTSGFRGLQILVFLSNTDKQFSRMVELTHSSTSSARVQVI